MRRLLRRLCLRAGRRLNEAVRSRHPEPGQLVEIARLLRPIGIEPVSLKEAGVDFSDVEETGQTFLENAQIKARAAFEKSGLPSIGDDSGLAVDALNGAPGIYSARYAGEGATNEMRIEKLLGNLEGVEKEKRTARFVCAVCCVFAPGEGAQRPG